MPAPSLRRFRADDLLPLVTLWHETKRASYDFIPLEQSYTVEDDHCFFTARVLPRCEIWLAEYDDALAGFLALEDSYVDRLYVHPSRQRLGVGRALLARARERSPEGLELHTHQKNTGACRFYEAEGFVAVRYGVSPPPESEPDVEYHWRP